MEKLKLISKRIKNPIGCLPLRKYASSAKSVLIITDDNTRFTPLKSILPIVLNELRDAGITNKQLKILIASGTHRPMTKKEIRDKFGSALAANYKIYNHSWNKESSLSRISEKIRGRRICINRLAKEADFIVGIGSIVPHATTGFSGGGKIILPGICGKETVEDMHWEALNFQMKEILGVYDNPMRRRVDSVAEKSGLKFIVNAIMDCKGRLVDVVAGDPVKAHKKGVELAKAIFGLPMDSLADIVIADAKPMDIDLRQAIKAVASSELAVKDGGVIILLARCPEGAAPQFPEFEKYGFSDPDKLKVMAEKGKINRLAAYTLIAIGRIIKYKAKVILVSKGIPRGAAEKLGFLWARSLEAALRKAKDLSGQNARVVFLKRACEVLPLMN
ncbi:MAG: nickel-dependent lactate racemase [Candidatus Omnitrophota bacterium]|nr:nickel-dependent lactate racemase [Candidatus Omnitrophota bacterium]